jgi:hypothetical protein
MADRTISVTEAARMVPVVPPVCPAARLAEAWPCLPHLTPADARAYAADLARARGALPPPRDPWA